MGRYGCVKSLVIAFAAGAIVAASLLVTGQDLFINMDVSGGLDAQFQGLEILAAIAGNVDLVGDITCTEPSVWMSATGAGEGVGLRDILSLTTKGWILISAEGVTVDTDPIHIRSLLYASRQSLIPLQADDPINGVHHTVIQIGGDIRVYWGEFTGTLAGGLVPSGTIGIIRLTGSGSLQLTGEWIPEETPASFPDSISLDDPDLPDVFLQTIDDFFDLPEVSETGNNTFDV